MSEVIMSFTTGIIIGALLGGFIYCIVAIIKDFVTFHWQIKILNAISKYQKNVLDNAYIEAMKRIEIGDFTKVEVVFDVSFDDMEDFNDTYLRWYDWGYKNILPKEKLEIIKPYMNRSLNRDE